MYSVQGHNLPFSPVYCVHFRILFSKSAKHKYKFEFHYMACSKMFLKRQNICSLIPVCNTACSTSTFVIHKLSTAAALFSNKMLYPHQEICHALFTLVLFLFHLQLEDMSLSNSLLFSFCISAVSL